MFPDFKMAARARDKMMAVDEDQNDRYRIDIGNVTKIEQLDINSYQQNYIVFTLYQQQIMAELEEMAELLENKIDKLLEKFTSMEGNISSLHTKTNNMNKEIKTNTEKINEKLRIHTELINEKLRITRSKVENLEASIKFIAVSICTVAAYYTLKYYMHRKPFFSKELPCNLFWNSVCTPVCFSLKKLPYTVFWKAIYTVVCFFLSKTAV